MDQIIRREWTLPIDVDMVLRGQGADPDNVRRRRPRLVEIAQRALDDGLRLIEPTAAYRRLAVSEVRHDRLVLADGAMLRSTLLVEQLASAQQVVVIVCTIGPALEERVSSFMDRDPAYALALDGFGSVAVDALGAALCDQLEMEAAREGRCTSMPLGPGMMGWPVEVGQPQIFSLLDTDAIGVTLQASAQMLPRKSASMVVGVAARPFEAGRTCDFCALRDTCRYQDRTRLPAI